MALPLHTVEGRWSRICFSDDRIILSLEVHDRQPLEAASAESEGPSSPIARRGRGCVSWWGGDVSSSLFSPVLCHDAPPPGGADAGERASLLFFNFHKIPGLPHFTVHPQPSRSLQASRVKRETE